MTRPHIIKAGNNISCMTLKYFSKRTNIILKSFIRALVCSLLKTYIDSNLLWPKKKDKLNKCHNGVSNMIILVYELQINGFISPTGANYRDYIVDKCGTLKIYRS